jgi:hypothetical protein
MKEEGEPVAEVNDQCYKVVELCKEPLQVTKVPVTPRVIRRAEF